MFRLRHLCSSHSLVQFVLHRVLAMSVVSMANCPSARSKYATVW